MPMLTPDLDLDLRETPPPPIFMDMRSIAAWAPDCSCVCISCARAIRREAVWFMGAEGARGS
eukprot:CAMPEP_0177539146 /NCGR_PEP_ID=MMETSP0369-20130122/58798_1 /TAXON_ID=447022 ORGANISM="Scrippsiella hangoei-like, Strain SHHI-4" /NCGR_SAMPLE_ID=MMETSP0369 /ASSEMBLY_ACC=CAM_ASM_000364 /LENGTH=61 /DNA_ID=CAMNT_0019022091 /DNA_START=41 /DNA_END=222 /DNA_ORIENTATION=+